MSNNINNIIEKYWAGTASLEEEAQLRAYLHSADLQAEHKDLVPYFSSFDMAQTSTYSGILDYSSLETRAVASADVLVPKYMAGETSLAEEESLKLYFSSDKVKEEHKELIPLFSFFIEQEKIRDAKEIDTTAIYEAETSTSTKKNDGAKTKVRRLFPKVATIAASLALLLTVTFTLFKSDLEMHKNLAEAEDTEAALEVTMQALAFLGHNYDKGANPMKHIKQLEKTSVFKFN